MHGGGLCGGNQLHASGTWDNGISLERVSTRDRNSWYADLSRYECEQIEGPLRDELIEAVGEEIYAHWVQVRRALAGAVAVGALRPTHLRGYKPEA